MEVDLAVGFVFRLEGLPAAAGPPMPAVILALSFGLRRRLLQACLFLAAHFAGPFVTAGASVLVWC
jgi:hypothetical protein